MVIQADKTEYSCRSKDLLRLHDSLCRGRILEELATANSLASSEFSENRT